MENITWDDFIKVELRAGTILEVKEFPQALKPAYKLKIDFGEFGILWSSAQITKYYSGKSLIGKQVVAVVNFPKKQIARFISECLVTGFEDEKGNIVLTTTDIKVPNGSKMI